MTNGEAVEPTPTDINIDDDIEILTGQVRALRRLGDRESVGDAEIYDFSIRWGAALAGRLPRLVYYSAQGRLTDADQQRFGSLCDELRAVAVLAGNLGLALPALPETGEEMQ